MPAAFNSPKQRRKPVINVTPLIDVLFLLLIFFMVSSTFRDDLAIDITLPKAQSATVQDVTAKEIAIRNGAKWEVVRTLVPGTWYTLRLTLDHAQKTYSGVVGKTGAVTTFRDKRLSLN